MHQLVRYITLLIAVVTLRSHALTKKAAQPNLLLNLLHHSRLPEVGVARNISGQFMLRLLGQEETADEEIFTLAVTVKKGLLEQGGPPRPGAAAATADPSPGQARGGGNGSALAAPPGGGVSPGEGNRSATVQQRSPAPGGAAAQNSSSNGTAAEPEHGHPSSMALHSDNASMPGASNATTLPQQNSSGSPQRRKRGTACAVAKNREFCLEGNKKYLAPYLEVLISSDIGDNYAKSEIIPSTCADIGFTRFGKKNGCYKKRLATWFHPGARGDAELSDNHYAQADQQASGEWVANHSTDDWEEMMQTSNPCNNSYPWDP